MTIRMAVIQRSGETPTRKNVEAYLYSNYAILVETPEKLVIQGSDYAGFTLDAIRDRLASGLIFAREVK